MLCSLLLLFGCFVRLFFFLSSFIVDVYTHFALLKLNLRRAASKKGVGEEDEKINFHFKSFCFEFPSPFLFLLLVVCTKTPSGQEWEGIVAQTWVKREKISHRISSLHEWRWDSAAHGNNRLFSSLFSFQATTEGKLLKIKSITERVSTHCSQQSKASPSMDSSFHSS